MGNQLSRWKSVHVVITASLKWAWEQAWECEVSIIFRNLCILLHIDPTRRLSMHNTVGDTYCPTVTCTQCPAVKNGDRAATSRRSLASSRSGIGGTFCWTADAYRYLIFDMLAISYQRSGIRRSRLDILSFSFLLIDPKMNVAAVGAAASLSLADVDYVNVRGKTKEGSQFTFMGMLTLLLAGGSGTYVQC